MDKSVFIADSACVYGKVHLKSNVNIWFNVTIRADQNEVFIKENTNVQDNSVIHVSSSYPVTIGKNTTIGHGCIIHGCTIGDNTLIGMGTTVLNGAVIGDNCLVGAGSLLTQNKIFPENSLIMGRPARVIRTLTAEEIENTVKNAQHYVECAGQYRQGVYPRIQSSSLEQIAQN